MVELKHRNKILGITFVNALLFGVAIAHKDEDEAIYQPYNYEPVHPGGQTEQENYWKDKSKKGAGSGLITHCEAPGTGGYFVSKDKYPYSGAATACKALGGSLADLTNQNFLLASDLVLTCVGPNKRAWIGSWDYKESNDASTVNQDCMSIFVGNIGPGGGIDSLCPGDRPVLCQLHPSNVPHNSLYTQSLNTRPAPTHSAIPVHGSRPPGGYGHPNNGYPGYENGGYPGGSHGNKGNENWHGKHKGDGETVTVTVNNILTQFQLQTLSVTTTERVNLPPSTITLPASTVTLPGLTVTLPTLPPVTVITTALEVLTLPLETITIAVTLPPNTVTNTVVDKVTDIVTLPPNTITRISTLAPNTVTSIITDTRTLPASTLTKILTLPPSTIISTLILTREASTITSTLTLAPNTITLAPRTLTSTLTLPPAKVTLTKTHSAVTVVSTFTLPPVTTTVIQLAIREVTKTKTTTVVVTSCTPALQTITVDKPLTITKTYTEHVSPDHTDYETAKYTLTYDINTNETYYVENFKFPFVIPGFIGPGTYNIGTGVVEVYDNGSYRFISGSPPTPAGYQIVLPFYVPGFTGPGVYTLSPGNVVQISADGSFKFLTGGPPPNHSGLGWSFPFDIPHFNGAGTYTISGDAIVEVNSDGSYSFIRGHAPGNSVITATPTNNNASAWVFHFKIPNFTGPGVYTLSPGNVIQVNPDGSYQFLEGSAPTETSDGDQGGVTFSFPFNIPGFKGPGIYTLSPGNVVQVNPDGSYFFQSGGPPGGSSGTFTFPFNIPDFSGPGIYTLSPGNVLQVNNDGTYSFISGGPPHTGDGGATQTGGSGEIIFTFPFSIPNFSGPGIYTLSPGNVLQVNMDGSYFFISGGSPGSSVTATHSGGGGGGTEFIFPFSIPSFSGPGVYTLSPGNVLQVSPDGSYSFIRGGPPTQTQNSNDGRGSVTFSFPFDIPNFSGPGVYTLGPGNVLQVNSDGSYSFINGGSPSVGGDITQTVTEITSTLLFVFPFSVPNFNGPGIYTLDSGDILQVSIDGSYSFVSGRPPTTQVPNKTSSSSDSFTFSFVIPNFSGPGIYTLRPGNILQVNADGTYYFISDGSTIETGSYSVGSGNSPFASFNTTLPSLNLPTSSLGGSLISSSSSTPSTSSNLPLTFAPITLPSISYPDVEISGNIAIPSYSGPGVYTVGPSSVVSIDNTGSYTFLAGSGSSGNQNGNIILPTPSFPALTLTGGITVPSFTGPGTYTVRPGNVLVIDSNGKVSWIQGGPNSLVVSSSTGRGEVTSSSPLPTITLPTLSLPDFNLPYGGHVNSYTGPGVYTINSNKVISIADNGNYSYIVGEGYFGYTYGSVSIPSLTLPPVSLPEGFAIVEYSGPGIYTVSPGNVVSLDSAGVVSWIQGGPTAASEPAKSTYSGPNAFSTTYGSIIFSFPFMIPNFSGPGVYVISPGNVVQVNSDGTFIVISSSPQLTLATKSSQYQGFQYGSLTLPSITLPSINIGGIVLESYTGPGIYTPVPGNVISVGAQGVLSVISKSGTGLISGKSAGATISVPGLTLPSVSLPTYTLPGGYVLHNYHGPDYYTLSPGIVVQVDDSGDVSFVQGGPTGTATATLNGAGFSFPAFSLPAFSLPSINFSNFAFPSINMPTFSFGNSATSARSSVRSSAVATHKPSAATTSSAPGSFVTTIGLTTYKFPFYIPRFTGPGFYILSPGKAVQVNYDGTYVFIRDNSIQNLRLALKDKSVAAQHDTESSGFSLPGFSFSDFSKRVSSSLSSIQHQASSTHKAETSSLQKRTNIQNHNEVKPKKEYKDIFKNIVNLF